MKKIVDLLEAYVEWLVLGIGAVFMVLMVITYLFPPGYVKKELMISGEKKTVTPGNVDEQIASGPADKLDKEIADARIDPPAVGDFVVAFDKSVARPTNIPPVELAANLLNSQPVILPQFVNVGGTDRSHSIPGNGAKVTALPVPPAAQIVASSAGHTTVKPSANPNAAAGAPAREDISWITNVAVIPKSLADEWQKCFGPAKPGGPPQLSNANTQILIIKAWRSEKSFDGQWSPEIAVKQFEFSALLEPPKPNDVGAQRRYISWASRNIADIADPAFAPRADGFAGTIWKDPKVILQSLITSGAKTAQVIEEDDFDVPVIATQNYSPPGGGPPIGRGSNAQRAPAPARPSRTPPVPVAPPKAVLTPESLDPVVAIDKSYHPTSMPSAAPDALFSPSAAPADLMFDFHDDTVAAGKTYRYRVEYTLLNPVFDQPGAVDPAQLSQPFGLVSAKSEWGPEITVPSTNYFYCVKNFNNSDLRFIFDVYAWNDGKWHSHRFTVNPGDSIGQTAADGTDNIDFSTKYSYVESGHALDQKSIVTVVSDDGAIDVRDSAEDMNSPQHHKLDSWVSNPTESGDTNPTVANAPPKAPTRGPAPAAPERGGFVPHNIDPNKPDPDQ